MKTSTSARRTRPSRPFGEGIDPEQDGYDAFVADENATPPSGLSPSAVELWWKGVGRAERDLDAVIARQATFLSAKPAISLPPLSGGSDAATLDTFADAGDEMLAIAEGLGEIHHGDDFCFECDAHHEPIPAAPARTCRRCNEALEDHEAGVCWACQDDADSREVPRGPSAEDIAYEHGRSALLAAKAPVQPPAGLNTLERLAFLAGASDAARDYAEEQMAEFDRGVLERAAVWA